MKFNFEKVKDKSIKIAKKLAIGGGVLLTSISPAEKQSQDESNLETTNFDKIEILKSIDNNKDKIISFPETIQGGDYYEGKRYFNPLKKNQIETSDEDRLLLNQINNLERNFSKLSKEKFEILNGGISIITDDDLGQNIDTDDRKIDEMGIEITSPLDNKYILDILTFNIVNNMNNIKFLDKSSLALKSTKETKELVDNNYVKLKNNGYKHYIPEYYFVLTKKSNDSSIIFKIKVVSSRERKVVEEISIDEELPTGDKFKDPIFSKLVEEKIVPDIENEISKFLNRNINNY